MKNEWKRAWRWRFSTRRAARERRWMKQQHSRLNRHKRRQFARNNKAHIEKPLDAWEVI